MSLLSFGATAQTQNDKLRLCIYPYDVCVSGFIDEIVPKEYIEYLTNINGIKRDNPSTINLKSEKDLYSKIRIETDKGRISCSNDDYLQDGAFHPDRYRKKPLHNYREFVSNLLDIKNIQEGNKLSKPIYISRWKVNRLNENDKEITIRVFLNKTNELIGQRTYKLIPDTVFIFTPRLIYTDFNGNRRLADRRLIFLPINCNIPMQLVVDDGFGNTYKPIVNVTLRDHDVMYNTFPHGNQNPDSIIIKERFTIEDICIITKDSLPVSVRPIQQFIPICQ